MEKIQNKQTSIYSELLTFYVNFFVHEFDNDQDIDYWIYGKIKIIFDRYCQKEFAPSTEIDTHKWTYKILTDINTKIFRPRKCFEKLIPLIERLTQEEIIQHLIHTETGDEASQKLISDFRMALELIGSSFQVAK
ncbi:hypothetical protein AGMMS50249_1630 [candidate division SR1 bacterium]|nr:hypothetical protein AGMMS50249_1630 [candidate division SR1 bacterium]